MCYKKRKRLIFNVLQLAINIRLKNQNGKDDEDREMRWAEEQEKGFRKSTRF